MQRTTGWWILATLTGWMIMQVDGVRADSAPAEGPRGANVDYANRYDRARAEVLANRAADWRNGAVVYQIFVDRFAPGADPAKKRDHYAPPRRLRDWDEPPVRGEYNETAEVWSHELDFWGGDLAGVLGKLDYLESLGVDVIYLNPIHAALTNHKYDADDYRAVSPEYGDRDDVRRLAEALHQRGMKLVLDGVFNHMGRSSPKFQAALADENSPYRDWFFFEAELPEGYRGWADVANLPELRMEHPAVREHIYAATDSVVQGYLRDGVDGWRLDVAPELGFRYLGELTEAAHAAKPGALVVGENWVYPEEWMPALDAVMNLYYLSVIDHLLAGRVGGAHAGRLIDRMIADTGIDAVLKSWVILDNHDLPRIATRWPKKWRRRMAQVLQFTLPGSPCVYYGVETGMSGGDDPEQRGPMRWDLANEQNPDFVWMKKLLALRSENRALAIGDFRLLDAQHVLAFMRRTDRVAESTVVVANPSNKPVSDVIPLRDGKLMNGVQLRNVLGDGDDAGGGRADCGLLHVEIPAHTIWVLRPEIKDTAAYDPFKRVQ
jgi:cyclomaltodextrinase